MHVIPTRVFKENLRAFQSGKRRALDEGGTNSSKTFSIMTLLVLIAMYAKRKMLISVVSESLPHLKRGCLRDFEIIMGDSYDDNCFNKSESMYHFDKATIEFFGADVSTKLRGGRRDILYINECNNISYDSYRELDVRTSLFTFLDWNPTSEFWVHQNGLIQDPENSYIHSTYLDVKAVLPAMDEHLRAKMTATIANIESNKDKDPNWWNVYGLGRLGKISGLVHPYFDIIKEMPDKARGREIFGLDFGFTNDPTCLCRNIVIGDELYSQQLIYESGLTNQDISRRMEELGLRKGYDEIIADSSEPKSIEELYRDGWFIRPAVKGPDSVDNGIQLVNQYKQFLTEDSPNAIKEMRNYKYLMDKNGILINKPADNFNHFCDARRYALMYIDNQYQPRFYTVD